MSHGHGGGRRPKKHHEEEHENHERWLVSYADMMTLLMVLFIVMFAISAVDQKKFAALKDGLAAGFGSPLAAMDGGTGPLDDTGIDPQVLDREYSVVPPDRPGSQDSQNVKTGSSDKTMEAAVAKKIAAEQQAADKAAQEKEAEDFKKLEDKLSAELKAQGVLDKVAFKIDERGLVITVVTDKVVFAPDRAVLQPTGLKIIAVITPSLKKVANTISVEGHTSTEKVKTRFYPSDWDLSCARASAVVNYMVTSLHFSEKQISPRGWGHTRPAYAASSETNNSKNRRVEIIITSGLHANTLGTNGSDTAVNNGPIGAVAGSGITATVAGPTTH